MQNQHVSFEAVLSKMSVKCESLVEPLMIDQGEAGAVDKTKLFVIVSGKNRFRRVLDGLGHAKNSNPRLIETFHEFDCRTVADFEANQRVGFSKDEIRC